MRNRIEQLVARIIEEVRNQGPSLMKAVGGGATIHLEDGAVRIDIRELHIHSPEAPDDQG